MNGKDEITEVIDGRPHSELPPPVILTQTGTVGMMDACGAEWPDAHYDTFKPMADATKIRKKSIRFMVKELVCYYMVGQI